jgi:hypothetical protein
MRPTETFLRCLENAFRQFASWVQDKIVTFLIFPSFLA